MNLTYDPHSDALYIAITQPRLDNVGSTDVSENGVIIDYDADGCEIGYEFLSTKFIDEMLCDLPREVSNALVNFVNEGGLKAKSFVEIELK